MGCRLKQLNGWPVVTSEKNAQRIPRRAFSEIAALSDRQGVDLREINLRFGDTIEVIGQNHLNQIH